MIFCEVQEGDAIPVQNIVCPPLEIKPEVIVENDWSAGAVHET
jgi:hypothetical protein